jgi:hypothetical protein
MGVSGQRFVTAALYSRERAPGALWIGGWKGLRAGMDREDKERNPLPLIHGSKLKFSSAGILLKSETRTYRQKNENIE